ncbi:hypothetical protein J6590_012432 [Homalodisca vitripennis]|nr:hypothetical protein J6590_012432 [Homalodisca vitripennis]
MIGDGRVRTWTQCRTGVHDVRPLRMRMLSSLMNDVSSGTCRPSVSKIASPNLVLRPLALAVKRYHAVVYTYTGEEQARPEQTALCVVHDMSRAPIQQGEPISVILYQHVINRVRLLRGRHHAKLRSLPATKPKIPP